MHRENMQTPCRKIPGKPGREPGIFSLQGESANHYATVQPLFEPQLSQCFLPESLNELEDHDLDALVADLGSNSNPQEPSSDERTDTHSAPPAMTQEPQPAAARPAPPNSTQPSRVKQTSELQTKADKINLALEKLKEAKVRKLIVKVLMSDGSSKTLMVDERQSVREVLDTLFEKTHCDCSIDWSLCETDPELQIERGFEDHEYLVELLSAWTRHSENKICFLSRPQKYVMFTDPQLFYMWKKKKSCSSEINKQAKELLIKEHFGGSALIVPDLEGTLYLKEDGKKVWKPRCFVLRASGIYYVPKGKTKSSTDLACFVRFEKVNVYTTNNYKQKYRAPTNFCFMLKHPCIQKESHYIKFLCCDDEHMLMLWVNSIRIAKYGTVLYQNYQAAVRRASTLQTLTSASHQFPPPATYLGHVIWYPYITYTCITRLCSAQSHFVYGYIYIKWPQEWTISK
uniref:Amyloid beta A4 precursor protein-binding family B member 1-interacting protein n=1 Tax=Amphiprion ocellaris TaxID=80972 RepID=A0A3Q1CJX0_AMPOC